MAQKTTYVVLEEGQGQVNYANPGGPSQQTYYVTDTSVSRKKKAAGGACCCFLVLLFFLLFFLIPRDPEVLINSATLTGNPDLFQPVKLSTNFEFVNRNFYKMEYSDLDITVCVWAGGNTCTIVGHGYYNSSSIDLGIRGSAPINVNIEPVATFSLASLAVNSYVQVQGSVVAETNGAVHKDFGRVNILPETIEITN